MEKIESKGEKVGFMILMLTANKGDQGENKGDRRENKLQNLCCTEYFTNFEYCIKFIEF